MFQYNQFWHFWFQLNSRNYFWTTFLCLTLSGIFYFSSTLFPPLLIVSIALPFVVGGTIALLTQLSHFFYNRQNDYLEQLGIKTEDTLLKEHTALYLNRRVICPEELLSGKHLNLDDKGKAEPTSTKPPLMLDKEDILIINTTQHAGRNLGYTARSQTNQLYLKTAAAHDALSEISAREMAELLGFEGIIPANTVAKSEVLPEFPEQPNILELQDIPEVSIPNTGLVLSREKIKKALTTFNLEHPEKAVVNTPKLQDAVGKFVGILKNGAHRAHASKNKELNLLYVQKFVPGVISGYDLLTLLFNDEAAKLKELQANPSSSFISAEEEQEEQEKREDLRERAEAQYTEARRILASISLKSFQENFLLHLVLGSQDANASNTLLDESSGSFVFHSIDHERIMPEDNYNITKRIPCNPGEAETEVENVFPIRLWLAGLAEANLPFTREIMEKAVQTLSTDKLLAYHRHKRLFSAKAVGAQIDRVVLIKKLFEEELQKPEISLTPKELFLKFINNHPTYLFLKGLQISDFGLFDLLGKIPESADWDFFKHPMQFFPVLGVATEMAANIRHNQSLSGLFNPRPELSRETLKTSQATHYLFFIEAQLKQVGEAAATTGLRILEEASTRLGV